MASTPSSVAADTTNPPSSDAAALSGWPSMSTGDAQHLRGRERLAGERVAGQHATDGRGRRRPEAARQRDLVVHRDPPADAVRQLAAGRLEGRLETAHEPVLAVLGQLVATFALDGQLDLAAAPDADLELDPVDQRHRQAEAVVAGTEVGGRGGHLDRDPAAVAFREPVAGHLAPYQPSATATAPTVGWASRNGGTWRSASRRVLEAVAGQDAHDGRIGVDLAGLGRLHDPGDACRRRGLAEDALEARERPVGGQDLLVGHGADPAARAVACLDRLGPRGRIADPDRGRDGLRVLDPVADDQRRGTGRLEAPHPGRRRR